jgi:hypothetical protein
MPRRKLSDEQLLARQPGIFMELAEKMSRGETLAEVPVRDKSVATSFIHRFNTFRNLLVDMKHPWGLPSKDYMISKRDLLNGSFNITFQRLGWYESHLFEKGGQEVPRRPDVPQPFVEEDGLPSFNVPMSGIDNSDPAEELLNRWMKKGIDTPEDKTDLPQSLAKVHQFPLATKSVELSPELLAAELAPETETEKEHREKIESCSHEWDLYGSCSKCMVAKAAWEKRDYKRS